MLGLCINVAGFVIRILITDPELFRDVFDRHSAQIASGFVGPIEGVLRGAFIQENQDRFIGDLGPDAQEEIFQEALYILRDFFF